VRAASQVAVTIGPDADRYKELDPKTISRHADHVEESWRDLPAGERLEDGEVPIAHDFGNVMDTGAELGMMSMRGLRDVIRRDPEAFAALRTKEAVSIAKLGIAAASSKETSRIKRNQQAIDVMAIFAHSSGFLPSLDTDQDDEARDSVDAMRGEVAAERLALEAG
jgi:hypothetical protein